MDNKINFVKKKVKKHSKKFSLFFIIGIFKSILFIVFNWLIIDILHINALIGSTTVLIIVSIITYILYIATKVIKKSIIKYVSTIIGFNIIVILAIWFLVDFMGFSGAFSSTIVVGIQFVLKYLVFNKIGLINHE
jgi:O-antigen/teichoic acid export membrane protein